jgi:hypothetical protein
MLVRRLVRDGLDSTGPFPVTIYIAWGLYCCQTNYMDTILDKSPPGRGTNTGKFHDENMQEGNTFHANCGATDLQAKGV